MTTPRPTPPPLTRHQLSELATLLDRARHSFADAADRQALDAAYQVAAQGLVEVIAREIQAPAAV